MSEEINQLSKLLIDAADDKHGAAEAFYELLLSSEVYIPTDGTSKNTIAEVGTSHVDELGYVTVDYEGQECLPIFSEESFLHQWAGKEVHFTKKSFSSLLWLIGDMWMYLDSNQQAGKEITAWEIELLKKGKDCIPELVAAASDSPLLELEVETNSELFPELKRQLLAVLELSSKLDEAFIVGLKEDMQVKPMLGLKYNKKITAVERKYIREELQHVSEELVIVDDVGTGPNDNFFSDATPFFIRQKELGNEKDSIFSSIKNLFKK